MGPGLRADLATGDVTLDVVIAHRARRGQRGVDVVLGERGQHRLAVVVGGGRGVIRPDPGVAVGLEFEPHAVGLRPRALTIQPIHRAGQVLDVMAVLVGHDVHLRQLAAVGPVLRAQGVEEGDVDVQGRVGGAVERADVRRRRTAPGLDRAVEDRARGLDEIDAGLRGELCPQGVRGFDGRLHQAVVALVGVLAGLALFQGTALGDRALLGGRGIGSTEQIERVAAHDDVDHQDHDQHATAAAAELQAAAPAAPRAETAGAKTTTSPAATCAGDVI